ncbi:MAG: hypothetical protein A2086_10715 [Spirochaetes bacterium GWD1_27_9]|nr:MAG: hypothetical protein A2Z98_03305 [Spirochaetes bacterium GWB1_27_13]OHD21461.1 MAG: hypothetical protein A2Y34_01250 [Spirochaetes bacterium GWC1_27_15]OHD35175.1 MAG: hypothetical protein A2086_10715 [Spirochaetes bacterium GWD1_27_9]
MIYDCFLFFNEFELLEIRLNELGNLVDKFVICESNYTFQGNPKPLYLLENMKKYEKYSDKIIHLVFDAKNIKGGNKQWDRDSGQRNYLINGLKKCKKDDIIILSDIDEIPDAKLLLQSLNYLDYYDCLTFYNNFYAFKFNLSIGKWYGTTVRKYPSVKKINNMQHFRDFRDKFDKNKICLIDGGWHFTFLGDTDRIQYKFDNWAHTNDYKIKDMKNLIDNNIYFNNQKLIAVPIDNTFPKYLFDNKDKFKDLIAE